MEGYRYVRDTKDAVVPLINSKTAQVEAGKNGDDAKV